MQKLKTITIFMICLAIIIFCLCILNILPSSAAAVQQTREASLEGYISASFFDSSICYLTLDQGIYTCILIIFPQDYSNFTIRPDQRYLRRAVRVTGQVQIHGKQRLMILRSESQITIINHDTRDTTVPKPAPNKEPEKAPPAKHPQYPEHLKLRF